MEHGPALDLGGRLDTLLRTLLARRDVHHAVMAVESGDRSLRWTGAGGDAHPGGPVMRADSPFFIASIDKLFTATVTLKLCEQQRVALNEPITSYLPPAITDGLHRLGGVDCTGRITVRHLLGHTSGLADYLEDRPRRGRSLVERLLNDGDMSWNLEDLARQVREQLTPHFAPQPLGRARQKVRYSDTNYQLLNAIVHAVTGSPVHQVFTDTLFEPLDMRNTWVAGATEPIATALPPATLWAGRQPVVIDKAMASFSGVFSTADDLLRFLRALVRGTLFDSPTTLGLMQQRWNRFGLPLDAAALRAPGWPIEYGLGLMRFRLPRLLTPLRPVPALVGHSGSTGSWLFYCPPLDVFLAGTVDQATAGPLPYRFLPKVLRAIEAARPTG